MLVKHEVERQLPHLCGADDAVNTVADHLHLHPRLGFGRQRTKLQLLVVVVSCSHNAHDYYGHHDCDPVDPSLQHMRCGRTRRG